MGALKQGARTEPLRLDFRSEQVVVVTSKNEDRFVTTSKEAARACRRAEDDKGWQREFESLLAHVHEWCKKYPDIDRAYLGFGDEGLRLFLVTGGTEYSVEMDEPAAELSIELEKRFPGCPADVMHLPSRPKDVLHTFFSPPQVLELYAKPEGPSQSGSPQSQVS